MYYTNTETTLYSKLRHALLCCLIYYCIWHEQASIVFIMPSLSILSDSITNHEANRFARSLPRTPVWSGLYTHSSIFA